MKIRVLGCYGSELPGFRPTAFLINDTILLDAGTVTSMLSLVEQLRITHVFVTHSHFDHIKDILFLADNVIERNRHAVCIASLPSIIGQIKSHLLNNLIWPDFSVIPEIGAPVLSYLPLDEEKEVHVSDVTCKAVRVHHTVEAVGYIVRNRKGALLYSGDTGPTQRLWDVARTIEDLKAVIIEVSFPNDLHELAVLSGHLTPDMLREELLKLGRPDVPTYVFHMKPIHLECIKRELDSLTSFPVRPLVPDEIITF